MYTFADKKGRSLTLRPEGTPGTVRALIETGWNFAQQAKLYYVGSMFRYQRPQKGRYREHTQVGVEIIGPGSVTADIEVISIGVNYLMSVGLDDLRVAVNTIGSVEDRSRYNGILSEFIEKHKEGFCPDCHFRAEHNPMRVFDCKVPECHDILNDAPGMFDTMSAESLERFETLKELLDAEGIEFDVEPKLVRGLDYYTHTVFEVMMSGDEGQQSSLMGGGRYDGLVEMYGGPQTPAMGFGSGLERVVEAIDWSDLDEEIEQVCDVAIVALGAEAQKQAVTIADRLRVAGLIVHMDHRDASFKNQLGQANTLKAPASIILGENELEGGIAILKEMGSGEQENVPLDNVVEIMLQAFSSGPEEE
jgi:histidyl-tRNA synthetase